MVHCADECYRLTSIPSFFVYSCVNSKVYTLGTNISIQTILGLLFLCNCVDLFMVHPSFANEMYRIFTEVQTNKKFGLHRLYRTFYVEFMYANARTHQPVINAHIKDCYQMHDSRLFQCVLSIDSR